MRNTVCAREDCVYNEDASCIILTQNGERIYKGKMLCAFYKGKSAHKCSSCRFCEATRRLYCQKHNAIIPYEKMSACPLYEKI